MTEVKAISIADAMPKMRDEDRRRLEPNVEPFYIEGIYITDETRFEKLAKVNGFKIINSQGDRIPVKYRTTSRKLVSQLEKMTNGDACKNGRFPVPVGPVTVTTESTGNDQEQYVLVMAE